MNRFEKIAAQVMAQKTAGVAVGDFVMQKAKDEDNNIYAIVIGEQVGGGSKVISIQPWRGIAKVDSTKGWFPAPVKIRKEDVPVKLLEKLEKKAEGYKSAHTAGVVQVQQFESLNDATFVVENSASFTKGSTEIWYMKPDFFRDGTMGYEWLEKQGRLPDVNDLKDTHNLLGVIRETNLETIFEIMQGEYWSPRGQARSLIQKKGLHHTSMSVGDIIVVHGEVFMVDSTGFRRVK